MSLRIGNLTVLNVLIWKAFVQSYIEKTGSSLIFAHQCTVNVVFLFSEYFIKRLKYVVLKKNWR